jgi:hypothetical protein
MNDVSIHINMNKKSKNSENSKTLKRCNHCNALNESYRLWCKNCGKELINCSKYQKLDMFFEKIALSFAKSVSFCIAQGATGSEALEPVGGINLQSTQNKKEK